MAKAVVVAMRLAPARLDRDAIVNGEQRHAKRVGELVGMDGENN
jgi:hypothetical protein